MSLSLGQHFLHRQDEDSQQRLKDIFVLLHCVLHGLKITTIIQMCSYQMMRKYSSVMCIRKLMVLRVRLKRGYFRGFADGRMNGSLDEYRAACKWFLLAGTLI